MIRIFIFSLVALCAGVYLQLQFADDPGYVLISFKGYDMEATLIAFILSLLVGFVLLSGMIWLIKTINPFTLFGENSWLGFNRKKKARLATEKGFQSLLLGQWQQAYKLLVESANKVESPAVNYLAASIAAFQHGDKVSSAFCLNQAEKNEGSSANAIKSMRAMMELKSGQLEQSLSLLLELQQEMPSNPQVLNSMKDIYVSLSDWESLWQLLPELEKNKTLNTAELIALTEQATLYRINEVAIKGGFSELKLFWQKIPKQIKNNEVVVEKYLSKLLEVGGDGEAVEIVARSLKKNWNNNLVRQLGFVNCKEPEQQLLLVEAWVKDRPNDAVLAITLGRLSLRNQLWDKARRYFQDGLKFSNEPTLTAEINAELGRLLENLGEHELSLECYRNAMDLLERQLPDLPMPSRGMLTLA